MGVGLIGLLEYVIDGRLLILAAARSTVMSVPQMVGVDVVESRSRCSSSWMLTLGLTPSFVLLQFDEPCMAHQ